MRFTALALDVTERCNLACDYCYKTGKLEEGLSEEMGRTILRWFFSQAGRRPVRVSCMGGEPLLETDLVCSLAAWSREVHTARVKWGVTSNLLLLTEEIAERFRELEIGIHCSIDGTQEAHDRHRRTPDGASTWGSVVEKVSLALRVSPNDTARYTVHPDCVESMHQGVLTLLGLGFRSVAAVPVFCTHDWIPERLAALEAQMVATSEWFIAECRRGEDLSHIKWIRDGLARLVRPTIRHSSCGAGRRMIASDVRGDLYPCHRYAGVGKPRDAVHLGSVRDGISADKRRAFLDYRLGDTCLACENVFLCVSRCSAERWSSNASVDRPIPAACAFSSYVRKCCTYIHAVLTAEGNHRYGRYLKKIAGPRRRGSGPAADKGQAPSSARKAVGEH